MERRYVNSLNERERKRERERERKREGEERERARERGRSERAVDSLTVFDHKFCSVRVRE